MPRTLRSLEHARLLALLVAVRRERGLTQEALAARLSRPQSFVAKVENGERRIDVVEFLELAAALGTPPDELFRRFLAALAAEP
jgi:transcriptional regulator with XRE-family HTH domain